MEKFISSKNKMVKNPEASTPLFRKFNKELKPGRALQVNIIEQKHDLNKLMKSVANGTKRDSVNDLDYRKIIKLKKSEIELKEYV